MTAIDQIPDLMRRLGLTKPPSAAVDAYREAQALGLDMEVLLLVLRLSKAAPDRPADFMTKLQAYLDAARIPWAGAL